MSSKLFWVLAVFAIIVLGIIGSKFGGSTGPLKIDGSSIQAFRSSSVKMVKAFENDVDKLTKLSTGFLAAMIRAGDAMGGVEGIVSEGVRKGVKKMSDEEKDRYFESVKAKEEELEASILDGMTAEEVIRYGEDFEKATGRDLLPSP